MDDAVRARDAAREALDDIEPARLRDVLAGRLADAPMTPAVLSLLSARALDPNVNAERLVERAAGVQLIYEGLRLTRTLAHDEPWDATAGANTSESENAPPSADADRDGDHARPGRPDCDIDADLDILAADVLVSRGFYLLARTDAAEYAVETVRRFGRDQTARVDAGPDVAAELDRNLEASVLVLAVVTGTSAVGGDTPAALREYAAGLARHGDDERPMPPVAALVSETTTDRIASLSRRDDPVPSSATDG